ncbi:solute carrier family 23 member 1-like [Styela clava]
MKCFKKSKSDADDDEPDHALLYGIDEVPAWYTCIGLGFQHYLTMLGSNIAVPLILAEGFCLQNNNLAKSEIISTIFFVGGIVTLLQTSIGVRLPIVQGAAFSFLAPTLALLSSPKWKCNANNLTENNTDDWQAAMREVQGSIMVASSVQFIIGITGAIGFLMKYIGPLTVAPTVTLVGLSLFGASADSFAGKHWGIAVMTIGLIIIFSQHIRTVPLPFPYYARGKGMKVSWIKIFSLYPILLAICVVWGFCGILTATDVFPTNSTSYGYEARTDIRLGVLQEAAWFRVPYPGQWGLPTVSLSGVLGMISGVLASIIESIGDYYACARLCGISAPPKHALNRGILVEGVGCLFAGAWGSGSGTTSYSENIGAIGVTKVGSRRVVQTGACLMIILAVIGKFGALFTTIPDPIVGGMFCVMFGMIAAVGMSNLQFVDLNSTRNLLIMGFATFMGIAVPEWVKKNEELISTGIPELDQVFLVLLQTGMFVAGFLGFLLDNTIPGTKKERGLLTWNKVQDDEEQIDGISMPVSHYDLPFGNCGCMKNNRCNNFMKYIPICPAFGKDTKTTDKDVTMENGIAIHEFDLPESTRL